MFASPLWPQNPVAFPVKPAPWPPVPSRGAGAAPKSTPCAEAPLASEPLPAIEVGSLGPHPCQEPLPTGELCPEPQALPRGLRTPPSGRKQGSALTPQIPALEPQHPGDSRPGEVVQAHWTGPQPASKRKQVQSD